MKPARLPLQPREPWLSGDGSISALVTGVLRRLRPDVIVDANPDLGADSLFLDEVLRGHLPDRTLRVWQGPQRLVTTRRLARLPGFASAAALSEANGWPVEIRASAGSTVVHRPGVLNVSLFTVGSAGKNAAQRGYRELVEVLADALSFLGVPADHGDVPGSFCDGTHNLRWEGRKLAGTAALVRQSAGRIGCLAHAVLAVEGDIDRDVAAVVAFERLLGLPAEYRAEAHCSVADAIRQSRCALSGDIPAECIRSAA